MILGNLYMKRKRYLISILMNLATVLEEEEEEKKKRFPSHAFTVSIMRPFELMTASRFCRRIAVVFQVYSGKICYIVVLFDNWVLS